MDSIKVSNNMLERMPVYLNFLKALPKSTKNISATKIAGALGLGEVSVRKDLAKISNGGRCKLGYDCKALIHDIEAFLGVKSMLNAVVIGKGEILQALLNYEGFEHSGLDILAGFDVSSSKKRCCDQKVIYPFHKLKEFCKENSVQIGVIMVSVEVAQVVCDQLVSLGVEGIWNFTPVHLEVPGHVILQNESFTASITKFRMQLREKEEEMKI